MTPETIWSNVENDHIKRFCLFDVSNDHGLNEAFNWMNTQLLLKEGHRHKRTKFILLNDRLHFLKAYQFLELSQKRFC